MAKIVKILKMVKMVKMKGLNDFSNNNQIIVVMPLG